MTFPIAVSPSQLVPGVYVSVNLLAGTTTPGTGVLRVALLASQVDSGTGITDDTELKLLGGIDDARTVLGPGTIGALAAEQIYNKFNTAQVYAVSPTAGAGTATLNLTLSGTTTANNAISVDIHGVTFEVSWLTAEISADVATKVINAINARTNQLAVVASSGGASIVTIDSKTDGNIGNDVLVKAVIRDAVTGTEAIAYTDSPDYTNLVGGTGDADFSSPDCLATIAGLEFHYIVACLSNADVSNVSSTNNVNRITTHIASMNSGLNAKLQQVIAGYTGTQATAIATTTDAQSFNNVEYGQMPYCDGGRGLPGVLAGREAGGRLAAVTIDPAANRINEVLDGYIGSPDIVADRPTETELQSLISAGVSVVSYTAQDAEYMVRPITTHSQDSVGGADTRLLDVQNVDAAYIVVRDIRDNIFLEFPQAKIIADLEPGDDPAPAGVVQVRDVKAWIISRLRFWDRAGVISRAALDAAIADGSLIVRINPSDATQVDIVIPFEVIQPWAKAGIVGQRVPS